MNFADRFKAPDQTAADVWLDERLFSDMFHNSPVGMCILKGPEHRFLRTNAVFDKVFPGGSPIGKTVSEAFPEVTTQGIVELLDEVYRTGKSITLIEKQLMLRGSDGELRRYYLDFMYQPYRGLSGEIEGIFYFGVDVTDKVHAMRRIEESEWRYRQIVETAQEGIWLLDRYHNTLFANGKMCQMLGYELSEIVGKNIVGFLDTTDPGSVAKINSHPSAQGPSAFEVRFIARDGHSIWAYMSTTRMVDPEGHYDGLLAMVMDITARKAADEELKKLSLIARNTTNSIILTSPSHKIEWVNDAFTRMTGYSLDEVKGRKPSFLFGPKTDRTVAELIGKSIEQNQPYSTEIMKYRKDQTPFWVEMQGLPVFDEHGNLSYYFNVETDITGRKQDYQRLVKTENQIRTFARQLNNILEDERARLAREIHDEFGQQLTGLKMSLSYLEKLSQLPDDAVAIIRESLLGVENTLQSLRNLSTELRPGILDTLGLAPSVEWLVRSFEKKSGISCQLQVKVRQQSFERNLSNAYFRICQEALTNVLKHSEATKVKINLIQHVDSLSLEVSDNGKGIVSEKLENAFSLGLLGMQERARLIDGELEIESQPGQGTYIKLTTKVNGK